VLAQLRSEQELGQAIERDELRLFYQPIVDIESGAITGFEALLRWDHPELGLVEPARFIPLAEETGLITEIGDFMLDEGCRCASNWNDPGHRIEVAVNVSAAQLANVDFIDRVRSNIDRYDLLAENLIIEITESLPVPEAPDVLSRLIELGRLGLNISVDDFGTGHSSVARLLALPVNELKLDQSLVQSTETPDSLTDAIGIAQERGLRIVAEGVETEEHYARARTLGCDRAQGYFFGRPTSEQEISRILAAV
jgi:EAL domain-containing protein (putative c-di-GMP-specific phosphodiesterase class I)